MLLTSIIHNALMRDYQDLLLQGCLVTEAGPKNEVRKCRDESMAAIGLDSTSACSVGLLTLNNFCGTLIS